jgi:hypothetical protein
MKPDKFVQLSLLGLALLVGDTPMQAQEYDRKGYIKELASLAVSNDGQELHYDNILHHRQENRWEWQKSYDQGLSLQLDLRTRLLSGYSIKNTPGYAQILEQDPGFFDMSWVLAEADNSLLHSTIDRLQMSYFNGPWDVRIGRQRLNWGQSMVWNPNDLFNTYSFLDFDYEERPGTDALSVNYSWDFASSFSVGFAPAQEPDESVIAFMLREHWRSYDWQIISGRYKHDWVMGIGWTGPLVNAGFHGELSYFWPHESGLIASFADGLLATSAGFDYLFEGGWYLNTELLYNDIDTDGLTAGQLFATPSPKQLFIEKTGYLVQTANLINPLLNASVGLMGSFHESLFILFPQLSYSLSDRIDVLFLSYLLKGSALESNISTPNQFFIRIKYSY